MQLLLLLVVLLSSVRVHVRVRHMLLLLLLLLLMMVMLHVMLVLLILLLLLLLSVVNVARGSRAGERPALRRLQMLLLAGATERRRPISVVAHERPGLLLSLSLPLLSLRCLPLL